MSEIAQENAGPPIGTLHEVRANFTDPDAMQDAVARLETSGFDRADLSLPEVYAADRNAPRLNRAPRRWTPRRTHARRARCTPAAPPPP